MNLNSMGKKNQMIPFWLTKASTKIRKLGENMKPRGTLQNLYTTQNLIGITV